LADTNRLVPLWSLILSTADRQRLRDMTVRGSATCLAHMRAR
jgi:hypothetical protein